MKYLRMIISFGENYFKTKTQTLNTSLKKQNNEVCWQSIAFELTQPSYC